MPDAHDAITSNAGWDTLTNRDFLTGVAARFHEKGIRVSVFVDPDPAMVAGAKACGADRVELYTEAYAREYPAGADAALAPYLAAAEEARRQGLGLNAGHDLSLENLRFFVGRIPWTDEVSIGHALICDALYYGPNSSTTPASRTAASAPTVRDGCSTVSIRSSTAIPRNCS